MNIITCKEKSIKKKDKKMKYWEIGEKNRFGIECYKLHLKLPYGDEKVIAAFVQDENNNNKYICVSNELNIDYDTFIADSVENAKKQVEGMLLDHWKEQIVYLEDCIDLLQNKEEQKNGKEKNMKWRYESII